MLQVCVWLPCGVPGGSEQELISPVHSEIHDEARTMYRGINPIEMHFPMYGRIEDTQNHLFCLENVSFFWLNIHLLMLTSLPLSAIPWLVGSCTPRDYYLDRVFWSTFLSGWTGRESQDPYTRGRWDYTGFAYLAGTNGWTQQGKIWLVWSSFKGCLLVRKKIPSTFQRVCFGRSLGKDLHGLLRWYHHTFMFTIAALLRLWRNAKNPSQVPWPYDFSCWCTRGRGKDSSSPGIFQLQRFLGIPG